MNCRITKTVVDQLAAGTTVYDDQVRGFGVRCGTAHKTYHLKYFMHGRQRWFTIGKHGSPWTPELARKRALDLLLQIGNGDDPQTEKIKLRRRETFSTFAERYLAEYAKVHKKPRSVRLDATNLRHHILPLLGRRAVDELTRADIAEFQRDVATGKSARMSLAAPANRMVVKGGQVAANRCLTLLSKMFNLAEEMGLRSPNSNPVTGLRKFPENRRERYLSEKEFIALGRALDQAANSAGLNPFALNAIQLLILTGARVGEILTLRWEATAHRMKLFNNLDQLR